MKVPGDGCTRQTPVLDRQAIRVVAAEALGVLATARQGPSALWQRSMRLNIPARFKPELCTKCAPVSERWHALNLVPQQQRDGKIRTDRSPCL